MNAAQAAQLPEIRSQRLDGGSPRSEAISQKPERREAISEEAGEDAEVATNSGTSLIPETNTAPPPSDDEGYVWPEGAEAATEAAVPSAVSPEIVNAPLPSMDELVKRIPTDVRETLDELFRVKFVGVKRVPPSLLKG